MGKTDFQEKHVSFQEMPSGENETKKRGDEEEHISHLHARIENTQALFGPSFSMWGVIFPCLF